MKPYQFVMVCIHFSYYYHYFHYVKSKIKLYFAEHTRTFIRDCSDGTSFFSDDVDVYLQNQKVKPDNQTSCEALTSLGITACVTLCGYNEFGVGDFCNGPTDISKASSLYKNAAFFSILAALFFFT
jgi:hypothetical protein